MLNLHPTAICKLNYTVGLLQRFKIHGVAYIKWANCPIPEPWNIYCTRDKTHFHCPSRNTTACKVVYDPNNQRCVWEITDRLSNFLRSVKSIVSKALV